MEIIITSKEDFQTIVDNSFRRLIGEALQHGELGEKTNKTWLNNREARELLGLSRPTLQRYRSSGLLPFSKVGGNIYYRHSDIESLLEEHIHQ